MYFGYEISKKKLETESRILEINGIIKGKSFDKTSRYCPDKEGKGTYRFFYEDEVFNLINELKTLKSIKSEKIALDLFKTILVENFPNISFKVLSRNKSSKSIKLILIFDNIKFIEFSFYKFHMSFRITNELIYDGVDTINKIKVNELTTKRGIDGINFFYKNKPFYVNLVGELILISINMLEYNYSKSENLIKLINYFVDTVIPVFINSYYYLNKRTGIVEFFISELSNRKIYVKDILLNKSYEREYIDDNKIINKNFLSFKDSFSSHIPKLKKLNVSDYDIVEVKK